MNNDGEKRWNFIVIHETFKFFEQMAKLVTKKHTTLHSMVQQHPLQLDI